MAIKTILENLEGVPEGLHDYYAETDGKYVLKVEDIDAHPDVSNLRNAYQRVKDSDKSAREELNSLKQRADAIPEDFDPKLWKQAKSGELTEGLVSVRKELENKLSDLEGKLSQKDQMIRGMTVDRALGEALDAAHISNPAYRKAATAILKDAVKLGENGEVFVDSDMGPINPREYVAKWATSEEGKAFVNQPSGGGSKAGNPSVTSGPKSWADAKTMKEKTEYLRSKHSK